MDFDYYYMRQRLIYERSFFFELSKCSRDLNRVPRATYMLIFLTTGTRKVFVNVNLRKPNSKKLEVLAVSSRPLVTSHYPKVITPKFHSSQVALHQVL